MIPVLDLPVFYSLLGGVIAVGILLLSANWKRKKSLRSEMQKKSYPADTVILHQLGRGPHAPSMSPFALKLETYLRMAKIPYQNEHSWDMSSKGKCPWICYNKTDIADSQFCIDYLRETLGKDMNAHLSDEQKAIALAFRKMTEEDLFWCFHTQIYGDGCSTLSRLLPNRPSILWFTAKGLYNTQQSQAWVLGKGRYSYSEVVNIGLGDLQAMSTYLGNNTGDKRSATRCKIDWTVMMYRWLYEPPNRPFLTQIFPEGVIKQVPINIKNQTQSHGIGRHSQAEVDGIIKAEMTALSHLLGEKNFLMGNEPCETDCSIFGLLAQMKWHLPGSPHEVMLNGEFKNLSAYCERMKDRFWPDWDDCNTAGGTKEATK